MSKITQENADKYLNGNDAYCPCCGSDDIMGSDYESDTEVYESYHCEHCAETWTDVLTLDHIEDSDGNKLYRTPDTTQHVAEVKCHAYSLDDPNTNYFGDLQGAIDAILEWRDSGLSQLRITRVETIDGKDTEPEEFVWDSEKIDAETLPDIA